MSDDIATRLRLCAADYNLDSSDTQGVCRLTDEAADEIERLRAALPTWYRVVDDVFDGVKLGFTWIVSMRDLAEVPRDALVDHVVQQFRQGLIAELETE